MGSPILGVILQVTATTSVCIGQVVQKLALRRSLKSEVHYTKDWKWWLGLMMIIGIQPLSASKEMRVLIDV